MKIALSSGCFQISQLESLLEVATENDLRVLELTGNLEHVPDEEVLRLITKHRNHIEFYFHNYYPVPRHPFVLNLANPDTRERSLKHCRQAIDLSARLGIEIFSLHAGMAFAPTPDDLGHGQSQLEPMDFEESLKLLLTGSFEVADYAAERGVQLMIENNVVADYNAPYRTNGKYHFADLDGLRGFVEIFDHPNIFALIDAAHLKVTARTLEFDPVHFLERLRPKIRAIHLSDNDGRSDQNLPVSESSWFWDHLPWSQVEYISLEVYNISVSEMKKQIALTRECSGV